MFFKEAVELYLEKRDFKIDKKEGLECMLSIMRKNLRVKYKGYFSVMVAMDVYQNIVVQGTLNFRDNVN